MIRNYAYAKGIGSICVVYTRLSSRQRKSEIPLSWFVFHLTCVRRVYMMSQRLLAGPPTKKADLFSASTTGDGPAAAVPTRLKMMKSHLLMDDGGGRKSLLTFAACSASLGLVVASLRWRVVAVGDKISYLHGAFVLAMGFVFFVALTHFLHTLLLHTHLGRVFCRSYRLLESDALEITNK